MFGSNRLPRQLFAMCWICWTKDARAGLGPLAGITATQNMCKRPNQGIT